MLFWLKQQEENGPDLATADNKKDSQIIDQEEKLINIPSSYNRTDEAADEFSVGSSCPETNSNPVMEEQNIVETSRGDAVPEVELDC